VKNDRQVKLVPYRHNDVLRRNVNSVPELVFLVLHLQDDRLDRSLGWLPAFCDQVPVVLMEKVYAVENHAVVVKQAVDLLINGFLRRRCVQPRNLG
jgi:hypothetical protein